MFQFCQNMWMSQNELNQVGKAHIILIILCEAITSKNSFVSAFRNLC